VFYIHTFIYICAYKQKLKQMYSLSNYINRGSILLNNSLRPSHKKLSTVMLYATDRCNSLCKHCYIWNKKPKQHLPFEKIKEIISSNCINKHTQIGLEGGEFILHPEAMEIMEYLSIHHPKYDLLSNCVAPEKTIEAILKFKPCRVFFSLDGKPEAHDFMRGTPGGYEKVIQVIEKVHKHVPVSLMFTLTPFNNFEELIHVGSVCKKYNIDMRIGIYNNMEYFETTENAKAQNSLSYEIADIPEISKEFAENYDFLALYTYHRNGNLKLSCNSIRDSIVIYPNGDIPICQNKKIVLGNLFENTLTEIINSSNTIQLHKHHKHNCNECWINFHRKYDIVLFRNLEKVLPKAIIEKLMGNYYWSNDKKISYATLLQKQK
jgi:MoaA/NifB/PqqE/SkfB family radical SAM enzyme